MLVCLWKFTIVTQCLLYGAKNLIKLRAGFVYSKVKSQAQLTSTDNIVTHQIAIINIPTEVKRNFQVYNKSKIK